MNKTGILITGAAGGLGSACVGMALQLDVDVIIAVDLQVPLFKDDKILNFKLDVREEKEILGLKKNLEDRGISIKYLINNAGVFDLFAVSEANQNLLDKTLKVNLYGPILCTSIFREHLIQNKGRVIQISSVSVKLPVLFMPYPNSKIALEAFSISMRQELSLHGVKLIIVRPGAMDTQLIQGIKKIENPISLSDYQKPYNRFLEIAKKDVGQSVPPQKVAQLINKALRVKRPKRIYSINKNRKIGIVLLFPVWLRDRLIVKQVS